MSARRPPLVGRYTVEELALAGRNRGMPLEALRHDVTPSGLHYLLIHFDIPPEPAGWKLHVSGFVDHPFDIDLDGLKALPSKTSRVTLECAGNGRGQLSPRRLYSRCPPRRRKKAVSTRRRDAASRRLSVRFERTQSRRTSEQRSQLWCLLQALKAHSGRAQPDALQLVSRRFFRFQILP